MAEVLAHEYVVVDVEEVRPHPDNPRRGDLELIGESIEENGFFGALVVHKATGHILVGNHRWEAARAAGMRSLPALVLDVDEDRARRILLADNRTAELAAWDDRALVTLLNDLAVSPAGLGGTGFDQASLSKLLNRWWGAENDPEGVPEAPADPFSSRGDLWLLGEHRLLCGDATVAGDVDRLLAELRPRLMVTDPPYLVDYDGANHPQTRANRGIVGKEWDTYDDPKASHEFYRAFAQEAMRYLDIQAPVYQWHADMRRSVIEQAWDELDLLWHQTLLWFKTRPILTHSHFMWCYEPCAYGWRRGHAPDKRRRAPASTRDIWEVSNGPNVEHPTIKPLQVFTDPYSWHLRAGEWGYEPFCGSGTAIAAAEVTGRRCAAMELQPAYVDVACARWQRITGRLPVLESSGEAHDFDGA